MTDTQLENLQTTLFFADIIIKEATSKGIDNIKLTSLYRTREHNKQVGGSPTSQHLKGKAVDFKTDQTILLTKIIDSLINRGILPQGGLGLYNTHVHYDWRIKKARWNHLTP